MFTPTLDTTTLPQPPSDSWSFTTNWTISGGSPFTSVKIVSSSETQSFASESPDPTRSRSALVLSPDSPNSGPCEIKISFPQKHEIRKIYIRSTAHVYEIYYAPALQNQNMHRCTVHCSIAEGEDLVHAIDNEEDEKAISTKPKVCNEELAREKVALESDIDSSEDDWLEVKMPAPQLDKVFYEATAKITDAEPCIAFTLCLLSSQSKVSLYIDEIHVFADPLTSADSEYKVVQEENSVGCTPLATLAPILSQLSISDVDCLQDEQASTTEDKQETGLRTLDSTKRANGVPSNGKCNTCDRPSRLRTEAHASDREEQHDFPCGQVGRVLEQLTLRVAKIEDLLLRYEKNTLKPIISMEARLQQVEASMELLAKNSKSPAFLPTESNTRAFYTDGKAYPPCSTPEFERDDPASSRTHKPVDDTSISVSVPQFVPRLVVTAPAFSCDDDEGEVGASEQSNGFPFGTNKRNLSTSDVLDNTFDSFLSLNPTPTCIPNITATLPGAGGLGPPPFSIASPQQFFNPSSQQANVSAFSSGTSDHTAEIERQQARHGLQFRQQQEALLRQLYQAWVAQHPQAQPRQQVLEAHLGVFGQPRQLGTCHPGSVATSEKPCGSGFVGYQSNGFSKAAAQGGSFSSLASGGEGNLGAPSSVGEFAAYTTGLGGFTAAATGSGVPAAASGRGFPTLATSYVFPRAASGSRSDLPGGYGALGNNGESRALPSVGFGNNGGTGLPLSELFTNE